MYINNVNKSTPKSINDNVNYYNINLPNHNILNTNNDLIFQNRIIQINNSNPIINNNNIKTDCCLVKLKVNNNEYTYDHIKLKDNDCRLENYELDQNNQLLFDNVNGWSNKYCSNDNTELGSCKHRNLECVDFTTKTTCDNYNNLMPSDRQNRPIYLEWSDKPCIAR